MQLHLMSKHDLRDLHAEIDYCDRQLAYNQTVPSDDGRAAAVRKLISKRQRLVKVALELVRRGIEYDPKLLPRSFKTAGNEVIPTQAPAAVGD